MLAVATVIERIKRTVQVGTLQPLPDLSASLKVETIADLLRPWSEVYPGIDPPEDGDVSRSVFGYGGMRRARIAPRPRRNRRVIPQPRRISAPPKLISPGLFASIRGVWDWYQQENLADDFLLGKAIDCEGFSDFLAQMEHLFEGFYPLGCWLEYSYHDEDPVNLSELSLMLPHFTYDDPGAGVVEALLSGSSGVTWMLEHHLQDADIELPRKDNNLIGDVGFEKLATTYQSWEGKKSIDLEALDDCGAYFFDEAFNLYPQYRSHIFDIITDDPHSNCTLSIRNVESINFALAYWHAFEHMLEALPPLEDFQYNTEGITENFIHELCNVYRKANGGRGFKWQSPKAAAAVGKARITV